MNNRLRIISSFLDSRIFTKEYGKLFFQSLPPALDHQRRGEIREVFE